MQLKGLTINFLGDSITEGHSTTGPDKMFCKIIQNKYGLKFAYNYGVSGTRIARQIVPTKDRPTHDLTFEIRAETMNRNADAVVVFGGTNDYGHGDAPFGNYDSSGVYTFCGALNSLITKLKSDFPKSRIIFMTPIHRLSEEETSKPDQKTLKDYVDAILFICKKHGIDVIDLFAINPFDPADKRYVVDGLHPSDNGHEVLAQVVAEELLKL